MPRKRKNADRKTTKGNKGTGVNQEVTVSVNVGAGSALQDGKQLVTGEGAAPSLSLAKLFGMVPKYNRLQPISINEEIALQRVRNKEEVEQLKGQMLVRGQGYADRIHRLEEGIQRMDVELAGNNTREELEELSRLNAALMNELGNIRGMVGNHQADINGLERAIRANTERLNGERAQRLMPEPVVAPPPTYEETTDAEVEGTPRREIARADARRPVKGAVPLKPREDAHGNRRIFDEMADTDTVPEEPEQPPEKPQKPAKPAKPVGGLKKPVSGYGGTKGAGPAGPAGPAAADEDADLSMREATLTSTPVQPIKEKVLTRSARNLENAVRVLPHDNDVRVLPRNNAYYTPSKRRGRGNKPPPADLNDGENEEAPPVKSRKGKEPAKKGKEPANPYGTLLEQIGELNAIQMIHEGVKNPIMRRALGAVLVRRINHPKGKMGTLLDGINKQLDGVGIKYQNYLSRLPKDKFDELLKLDPLNDDDMTYLFSLMK